MGGGGPPAFGASTSAIISGNAARHISCSARGKSCAGYDWEVAVGGITFAIITGIAASILHGELAAWCPKICNALINWAVCRVPDELRERLDEEWKALIDDTPGPYSKLFRSISICVAGIGIGFDRCANKSFIRLFERGCAALLLMFFAPLMVLVTITLKISGERAFSVNSFGSSLSPYDVLKFNVNRNTAVGKVLWITSIDELPMLYNVMKGDIAFFTSLYAGVGDEYRDPLIFRLSGVEKGPFAQKIASLLWRYRRKPDVRTFLALAFFTLLATLVV